MNNKGRQLFDEAVQLWDADCDMDEVISQTRRRLSEPEPEAPTLKEVVDLVDSLPNSFAYCPGEDRLENSYQDGTDIAPSVLSFAQALLARYGCQPTRGTPLMEWQSIETAPDDGTEILATDFDSIEIIHGGGRYWENRDGESFYPCFWQPLPNVPEPPPS